MVLCHYILGLICYPAIRNIYEYQVVLNLRKFSIPGEFEYVSKTFFFLCGGGWEGDIKWTEAKNDVHHHVHKTDSHLHSSNKELPSLAALVLMKLHRPVLLSSAP